MWTDREVSRSQELGPGWALCLPSRPWAVLPSCFLRLSASGCMRRGPGAPQTPRLIWVLVSVVVKNPPPSAGGARDSGSIRGSGRTPGRGNGNPLQYSCLGNPMDRGAQLATVHGVTKSWTQLSTIQPTFCSSSCFQPPIKNYTLPTTSQNFVIQNQKARTKRQEGRGEDLPREAEFVHAKMTGIHWKEGRWKLNRQQV